MTKSEMSVDAVRKHVKAYTAMLNVLEMCKDMVTDHKTNAEKYLAELEGQASMFNEDDKKDGVQKKKQK